MNDITLQNFQEVTGRRFRVSRDQNERIKAGTLTREGALAEFLNSGGLDTNRGSTTIPTEVFSTPGLTLENFTELTGRRFRVSNSQGARIRAGELTREQAFQETVASYNGGQAVSVESEPETVAETVPIVDNNDSGETTEWEEA